MPKYDVKVLVEFNYEVDAESIAEAEEQGWHWEEYPMFAEVYSIDADEQYIPIDDKEDD
jgi:hypothetical protein